MGEANPAAMAAGLTDHRWSLFELLSYRVPLPAWVEPKRRNNNLLRSINWKRP
jgi:hypothetical protein